MRKNRLRRGFSLIELLIVIAIILIIAAIAVPKMNKQIMAAHEMAAIREIGTIHTGETQYYSQFGRYARISPSLDHPPAAQPVPRPPICSRKTSPTARPADLFSRWSERLRDIR